MSEGNMEAFYWIP